MVSPEGSSTCGAEVLRFRPSLLGAAAAAELPVSYGALTYHTPAGSLAVRLAVCWWGDMTFGRHVLDLLGPPEIRASLTFGERPITERNRWPSGCNSPWPATSNLWVSVEQV